MMYVGDLVKIVKIGSPYFGEVGKVIELKTAINDEWALVQTDGECDYFRTGELIVEKRNIPVEGALGGETK